MSDFVYLTTRGRRTGRLHTIEIWYGEHERTVYVLSGGGERSDWVRNLRVTPRVRVRLGGPRDLRSDTDGTVDAIARLVSDPAEDALARRLLGAKYQGWREGRPLSEWASESLVVALDIDDDGDGPR
jgi:deazaflavin-dependent oxidoreductase (nitroreductase family)